jgi:hypothetical protein
LTISPIPNKKTQRRIKRQYIVFVGLWSWLYLDKEKAIVTPTMNKKNGNTQSAKVQPFQYECANHGCIDGERLAILTRIIAAIVMPRKVSREIRRIEFL